MAAARRACKISSGVARRTIRKAVQRSVMFGVTKNIELWVLRVGNGESWAVAVCPEGGPRRVLAVFDEEAGAVRFAMKERQRRAEDEGLEIRVVLPDEKPAAVAT